jgi:N utilization substance protein B
MTSNLKSTSSLRGITRLCALQTLYRARFENISVNDLVEELNSNSEVFITENISSFEIDKDFFCSLLRTTEKNLKIIEEILSESLAANWRLERLDSVMRYILCLGIAELLYFPTVPPNVVFNEYIEISKAFFQKSDVAFVNGLLNNVANTRRH